MRGLVQGWPKQIGSIWMTRSYDLPSKANPVVGPGGKFGATLAVKDCRLIEATITLQSRRLNSRRRISQERSMCGISPNWSLDGTMFRQSMNW